MIQQNAKPRLVTIAKFAYRLLSVIKSTSCSLSYFITSTVFSFDKLYAIDSKEIFQVACKDKGKDQSCKFNQDKEQKHNDELKICCYCFVLFRSFIAFLFYLMIETVALNIGQWSISTLAFPSSNISLQSLDIISALVRTGQPEMIIAKCYSQWCVTLNHREA